MAFPDLTPQSELGLNSQAVYAKLPSLPWGEILLGALFYWALLGAI